MIRLRSLVSAGLLASVSPAYAQIQEVGPVNVYELSRALRESGQADLAIEYLDSLTAKLPKEQQPELKLERAKARVEQANQEPVDAKRDDLIAVAKKELEDFIKAFPTHPRVAEANIALARVTTLLGKQQLGRAGKAEAEKPEDTPKLRKTEMALARPFFEASGKQYAAAASKLEAQANAALAASTKRELMTGFYQALLDQGINQFYLGDSYGKAVGKEVTEKANAYKAARDLFSALSKRDEKHPLCWVAKAWEAECCRPIQEIGKADKANDEIRAAWVKEPQGAPAAGYRMSRFFTLRDKWLEADGKGATPAAFQNVRKLADEWMKDYKSAKLTPEHYAVMYYVATSNLDEAKLAIKYDEKTKTTTIPDSSRTLLGRAERDFRILAQSDNDYETRAEKERMVIIRLLVGEGTKNPANITTFDEAHMTMLVVNAKLNTFLKDNPRPDETTPEKEAKDYKQKKDELFNRVIALLNREKELPVPKESAREAANSQIMMIYLYRQAGRTYEAAVMAEGLARTARSTATIAKAGENAVYAYLEAFQKAEDEESKAADLARALNVASFLDIAAPEEPATEEIRLTQGKLLVQSKRYMDAFDVLCKIKLGSNSLVEARLLQGGIAYELLRAKSPMEAPAPKKNGIRTKAIADLTRVPLPSKPTDALRYVKLKLQLAQLYLTGDASGYPAAEKTVVDILAQIPTLNGLKDEDKLAMQMQAEMVHIDTVYGQAMPLFNAGQFKECYDLLVPMLTNIAKSGPANKDSVAGELKIAAGRLDAMRLDRLIMPSLSAQARQGEIESCTQLLDLAKLFGGDISKTASAVVEVIRQAKIQVEKLRAEKKDEEAKVLMDKVGQMLNKLLEEKNMTPGLRYGLAKACRDLGQYPKAIELINQLPKPKNIEPKQPPRSNGTESEEEQIKINAALAAYEDEMKVVNLYKAGQLVLASVYRLDKMFSQGDALYDEVLGKVDKDLSKSRKGSWASNMLEFRKEFFHYTEAKAAATTDEKAATALWVESIGNWSGLTGEYAKVINSKKQQLNAKPAEGMAPMTPEQKQAIEDQITRLMANYYDNQFETFRVTVAANQALYAKKPEVLTKSMNLQGKKIGETEVKSPLMPNEVRARYREFLEQNKALDPEYRKAGGVGFPNRDPDPPKPVAAAAASNETK